MKPSDNTHYHTATSDGEVSPDNELELDYPKVVGTARAARLLGFTERQVRRWCKDGKLKGAYQFARDSKWLIPFETLKEIKPSLKDL